MKLGTLISTLLRTTSTTLVLFISCISNGMDVLELQIKACDTQVQELVKERNLHSMLLREKPDQDGTFETSVTSYDTEIKKLLGQRKILAAQLQEITAQSKTEKNQNALRKALEQQTKHATLLKNVIKALQQQDVTDKPMKAALVEALLAEKAEDLDEYNQNITDIEKQIAALNKVTEQNNELIQEDTK